MGYDTSRLRYSRALAECEAAAQELKAHQQRVESRQVGDSDQGLWAIGFEYEAAAERIAAAEAELQSAYESWSAESRVAAGHHGN